MGSDLYRQVTGEVVTLGGNDTASGVRRMAQCENHADRQAVDRCAKCGKLICPECIEFRDQSGSYCFDCAVDAQLSEFRERKEEQQEEAQESEGRRFSRFSIVVGIILVVLIAGEIAFVIFSKVTSGKPDTQPSKEQVIVWERDRCVMAMQDVRNALDSFKKEHGNYPASLSEIDVNSSCPESGAAYVYQVEGDGYRLSCPNPGAHGAKEITATETQVPRPQE